MVCYMEILALLQLTQCVKMFSPVRVVATIVFLGSIGLVFVGAFVLHNHVSSCSFFGCGLLTNRLLALQALCISAYYLTFCAKAFAHK